MAPQPTVTCFLDPEKDRNSATDRPVQGLVRCLKRLNLPRYLGGMATARRSFGPCRHVYRYATSASGRLGWEASSKSRSFEYMHQSSASPGTNQLRQATVSVAQICPILLVYRELSSRRSTSQGTLHVTQVAANASQICPSLLVRRDL